MYQWLLTKEQYTYEGPREVFKTNSHVCNKQKCFINSNIWMTYGDPPPKKVVNSFYLELGESQKGGID